jgi:acetyl-CoA carboxylase beta subunit
MRKKARKGLQDEANRDFYADLGVSMEKEAWAKCPKCGYAWFTRARLAMVCCPNCMRKFER